MTDIVRSRVGKKRYELKRSWLWPLLTLVGFLVVTPFLLTGDNVGLDDTVLWFAFWIVVAVSLEASHKAANFVIVHPDHADISEREWVPRGKRRANRITYSSVQTMNVKDDGTLTITWTPESRVARTIGFKAWMVQVKMASHADALEIKEALELGRERARESADVLGV